jgi:hypothetical protein
MLDYDAEVPARTRLIRLISSSATDPPTSATCFFGKQAFDHISICTTVYNLVAESLLIASWTISHSDVSLLLVLFPLAGNSTGVN